MSWKRSFVSEIEFKKPNSLDGDHTLVDIFQVFISANFDKKSVCCAKKYHTQKRNLLLIKKCTRNHMHSVLNWSSSHIIEAARL